MGVMEVFKTGRMASEPVPHYPQRLSDLVNRIRSEEPCEALADQAASAIEELMEKVATYERRLEVDRVYVIGPGEDGLVERAVPHDERHGVVDGIDARDATIELLEDVNKALRAKLEKRDGAEDSGRLVGAGGEDSPEAP